LFLLRKEGGRGTEKGRWARGCRVVIRVFQGDWGDESRNWGHGFCFSKGKRERCLRPEETRERESKHGGGQGRPIPNKGSSRGSRKDGERALEVKDIKRRKWCGGRLGNVGIVLRREKVAQENFRNEKRRTTLRGSGTVFGRGGRFKEIPLLGRGEEGEADASGRGGAFIKKRQCGPGK